MIVIVHYGLGNPASIKNMISKIGGEAVVSSDPAVIAGAQKLILPGVGAFDTGMKNIHDAGLLDVLNEKALKEKVPVLGICLGMQLLTKSSTEGNLPGLGWVDADCVRFHFPESGKESGGLRVPHMGWNEVNIKNSAALFRNFSSPPSFYFVHSYHPRGVREEEVLATTHYGYEFVSAFQRGNIAGVQFHPEKSHAFGMQLLKNFLEG